MKKRDYSKPVIVHTEPVEGIAGSCTGGKTDAASCPSGPIAS